MSRPRMIFAAVAVAVLAACSIPIENRAQVIEDETVAYGLLNTTTSTVTTTVPELPTQTVSFFWHNNEGRLVIIVKGRDNIPDPGIVLAELVEGPQPADLEENPNLITVLDSTMAPRLSGPDVNGVHRIQIDRLAEEALSTDQAEEFVCTATQFDAIERVEIIDSNGELFSLSGKGAVALDGPASAEDFGDCVPDPPPADDTTGTSEEEPTTTRSTGPTTTAFPDTPEITRAGN